MAVLGHGGEPRINVGLWFTWLVDPANFWLIFVRFVIGCWLIFIYLFFKLFCEVGGWMQWRIWPIVRVAVVDYCFVLKRKEGLSTKKLK